MYKASVIITAYQAEDTIADAIKSVLNTPRRKEIEVIVVDDCSKDRTQEIVESFCNKYDNVRYIRMPYNTGSPSEPRNTGIAQASGVYVSTLDDDDCYDVEAFLKMMDIAFERDLDFVKGYMIVHEGNRIYEANRLSTIPEVGISAIREIVSNCSLTADFIAKRDIISQNDLKYNAKLKIGEDTVFLTGLMAHSPKSAYVDKGYLHYNKVPVSISNLSSTQCCGDREVNDQIESWRRAEKNLQTIGLSYDELRLSAGFRNLLLSIVRFSDGISGECYRLLHKFAKDKATILRKKLVLAKRYRELLDSILDGDYEAFCAIAKRRMVIAGYDLKFILPLIPYLEEEYNVQVDEWTGHNTHDEKQSRKMAEWADIIWCEWLLGNAVYYTQHKANFQRLVIRAHRFEATREFGNQIDYSKVDAVFAVSYYFLELFAREFCIPRTKMRLLSNYVEESTYRKTSRKGSVFDLGMVGILPARKGYLRALELLKGLRAVDSRFTLRVCGQNPNDVSWIADVKDEEEYFRSCTQFIIDNNLEDAVIFEGYKPRESLYENIGIVLSMSDTERVPESFHMSPAEGACAGCMGLLLNWSGVEYIYPDSAIFQTVDEMKEVILKAATDSKYYQARIDDLQKYVLENYEVKRFFETLHRYLVQVRIAG